MRVVEWFAGIGGGRLALEAAGHEVVGACEWDLDKRDLYASRFGAPAWFPRECVHAEPAPEADLWVASASPRLLAALMARPDLPPLVWLQTAAQPVDGVRAGAPHYRVSFTTRGRTHLLMSSSPLRLEGWPEDDRPVHRPDAERLPGRGTGLVYPNVEDAEEAQGFPRGWTAGRPDATRRSWLAQSVDVAACVEVARRFEARDAAGPALAPGGTRPEVMTTPKEVSAWLARHAGGRAAVASFDAGVVRVRVGGATPGSVLRVCTAALPLLDSQLVLVIDT